MTRPTMKASKKINSARKRDESGIALVLTAIFCIAFCGLVAFGVDLGYWYLQSERIQRAADNAALAAAASLPSSNAASKGIEAARKNGYAPGGNISVNVDAAGSRAVVTVSNNDVPTFFAKFVIPHLKIGRTSTAEKNSSLPMGSPYNVLGTGDLALNMKSGGAFPKSNTWLAINGPCSAREDGDYFMSKYIGNKATNKTTCPGTKTNAAYDINGYSYFIDVPGPQTNAVKVRLYDPGYNPKADKESPDGNLTQSGDVAGSQDTMYWLWQINDDDSETLVHTFGYRWFGDTALPGKWVDFATIPGANVPTGRKYRLQVAARDSEMTGSHAPRSWSVNAFSIMADTGDGKVCDSRTDASCPLVYGKTAVSLLNNVAAGVNNKATFMLAGVADNFAGSKASVSIFDPGEGVQSIEVLMPNGQLGTFDWKGYPEDVSYSGSGVTSIDVSGFGPQPYDGDAAQPGTNYKFNDRRVVLDLHIPANTTDWKGAGGNNWWQIQYTLKPGSTPLPDRTTWGADLGGNGPAHLVRN